MDRGRGGAGWGGVGRGDVVQRRTRASTQGDIMLELLQRQFVDISRRVSGIFIAKKIIATNHQDSRQS